MIRTLVKPSEEKFPKSPHLAIPVICIENGDYFHSMMEATKYYKPNKKTCGVQKVISGAKKTFAQRHWRRATEEEIELAKKVSDQKA